MSETQLSEENISLLLKKSTSEMSREELIELVSYYRKKEEEEKINASINKNIANNTDNEPKGKKKKKKNKELDWSKQSYQYMAFKFSYIGFNYQGLARQAHTTNTIEYHLFEAFKKVKLIENEESSSYTRCGRTDKGVSALCQVVSLKIRMDPKEQPDYLRMLNNNLPEDIRIHAYCPVDKDFDARFGCIQRTYKYFFVKGKLNIEKMTKACSYFIGEHDFRNFCKINAEEVSNFKRKILNVEIVKSSLFLQSNNNSGIEEEDDKHTIYEIIVCGYSFLWHQIRCMASILFLVGEEKEEPEIILNLLNIEKYPAKPQYVIASEFPLVLYDCVFEDLNWIYERNNRNLYLEGARELVNSFYQSWWKNVMKISLLNIMYNDTNNLLVKMNNNENNNIIPLKEALELLPKKEKGPKYVKLLDRPTANSYEECLESVKKKRKK